MSGKRRTGEDVHCPEAGSHFYCYLLECADGTFYTGWTTDPERRLREHNAGRGARYTRIRRPVRMVYVEPQTDRSSALRRERRIKALTHAAKKALITVAPLDEGMVPISTGSG